MPQLHHIEDSLVLRIALRLSKSRGVPSQAAQGDATTPRIAGLATGASAERLLREQPELLAFLLAGTGQLAAETRAVAVFLGEVVFETFRLAGRQTRAVEPAAFVAALRQNREMALRVGQAHDRIAERYLRNSNALRQPALIRYLTGVLLDSDPTCPHGIPRDELGPAFIILKSVIDVLDQDLQRAAAPSEAAVSTEPA